ncbi:DUF305 domain-containing protein [Rhodobacterales bacterium HKCCE3408]|nr:DUF305 domain-containing protein [Rhodobacterales bacterium HKCCE3408]
MRSPLKLAALICLVPLYTMAQSNHAGHTAMAETGPAEAAYRAANADMHTGMNIEFTGDADIDFARAMIAHHEGAVEMARILLEYGQDAELRALAEDIISAQETEIAFMRDWLARNGS